jgi:hypothetical protein
MRVGLFLSRNIAVRQYAAELYFLSLEKRFIPLDYLPSRRLPLTLWRCVVIFLKGAFAGLGKALGVNISPGE